MKQTFYKLKMLCALGVAVLGHAQGKVGVNTEKPTRTLDVNGEMRVRTLNAPSTFEGFLVSENIGNNGTIETNVVKRANVKGEILLDHVFFPETYTVGTPNQKGQPNIIIDNDYTWIKLPAVPSIAANDLELSPDGMYYIVKKSGFYNIGARMMVRVTESSADRFNGSFGTVSMILTVGKNKDDKSTWFNVGDNNTTIFKGAKTPIARNLNSNIEESRVDPLYFLYTSSGVFIPKNGIIAIKIATLGTPSIVSDRRNLQFNPKNSTSFINIYRSL